MNNYIAVVAVEHYSNLSANW